jgi:phosphosulfolactate synthase
MKYSHLDLPDRESKPRNSGLTVLLDNGLPLNQFTDYINNFHSLIDFIKFGWGTSLVTECIEAKINFLKSIDLKYFFGGTLFEKFLLQGKLKEYHQLLEKYCCEYVEISNGTIDISNNNKCKYIQEFSKNFNVFSEVGYKDVDKSLKMHPAQWVKYIREDIEAGAKKVITEARESGRSGICRENGAIRYGLIEEIISSGIKADDLIFEAPNKDLQTYFIERIGFNVNLANISFNDIIGLETLRLGLRSDTLLLFESKKNEKLQ